MKTALITLFVGGLALASAYLYAQASYGSIADAPATSNSYETPAPGVSPSNSDLPKQKDDPSAITPSAGSSHCFTGDPTKASSYDMANCPGNKATPDVSTGSTNSSHP